jgi:hypothetical protein
MKQITAESLMKYITFEFFPEREDMYPEDSFCDDESINWIHNEVALGNNAAWFCAHVVGCIGNYTAESFLGGCSYRTFTEFENDLYYESMRYEVASDLAKQINGKLRDLYLAKIKRQAVKPIIPVIDIVCPHCRELADYESHEYFANTADGFHVVNCWYCGQQIYIDFSKVNPE